MNSFDYIGYFTRNGRFSREVKWAKGRWTIELYWFEGGCDTIPGFVDDCGSWLPNGPRR